jgi:BirA family biotin operon repressor/biotin-[acetyl-CoA-carboxylase] ligase
VQEQIVAMLTRASEQGPHYVSGGDMAKELGITRAAVWKYIESIRKEGGIVQAVPRRGYRLEESEDLLLAGAVQMDTAIVGKEYVHLPAVDSTNSEVKRRIRVGCRDGLVVVADHQTAGRGRMGRTWHSVPGKSLCVSVALFPEDLPIIQAPLLTPLTAVAVYRAVVKVTGLPVELKWPNDLLLEGRKLGGILLEASGETDRLRYAIIGIGINVNSSQQDIPTALSDIATSLYMVGKKSVSRRRLLQEILVFLDTYYRNYLKVGPGPMMVEYRELCSTLGQRIRFVWQEQTWSGLATEITSEGGLVVETDSNETLILRSGDVHCL